MSHFLELLFEAPLGYNNQSYEEKSGYVEAVRRKGEYLKKLDAELTDIQQEWLENYLEAHSDLEQIRSFRKFSYGFHLGALMMLEVMEGRDAMLDVT